MKKMILFVLALTAMVGTTNAKTFQTTLWEDTYTSAIELNSETVATFKAGDVLRIYVGVPDGGANFNLVYKSEGNGWSDTAIPSTGSQWPWVNGGNTYYDVNFTDADITALAGQNIYIVKGENSTITKVELTGEVTPTGQTELLDASWTASWTAKTFAAQSGAKIGDVIRFSYSAPGGWSYFQFNILDAYGNADAFTNTATNVGTSIGSAADLTFDFEINNYSDMVKIQTEGFGIKGDNFTLTSVQLLTYADSYDAVKVVMGSDGIRTWSHSKNLDFTGTGLTAYYASAVAKGSVSMTETATTWNYCGYILRGDEGTYTIPVVADEHASYPAATYLKGQTSDGTVAASTTGNYHYIFGKKGSDYGFFRVMSDASVSANTAYLETATDIKPSSDAPVLIDFGGSTTGINRVFSTADGNAAIYNISGQRVSQPTHGLYIVGGRKIMVK